MIGGLLDRIAIYIFMGNYKMEIRGKMNLSDYSNIYDYIRIVGKDDDFSISAISLDSEELGIICSMLKEMNFSIKTKEYISNSCIMEVRKIS